jgi:hypothetical protein
MFEMLNQTQQHRINMEKTMTMMMIIECDGKERKEERIDANVDH